uniref:Secoisolariciresinol dehydrogenase 17 n=1 Tax=Kadsura heteroclita TaxID=124781 RepID=A0A7U3VH34_9MAGN|nr:secoisolariciresinol dehydrogenase 17 [Kadsura heteroclita]
MAFSSSIASIARRLEGKVALITGGASGIGECTARLFCQHGAKVVIADVQDQLGRKVCQDLGSNVASFSHCDVTKESDVREAVDLAVTKLGKLDIMFNNAGIIDPSKASILDNEQSDFERVLSVHVTGAFLGTKHAARIMIPAKSGCIISTSSVCSVLGGAASHAYTCAKHAIAGLTKNAAIELGQFGIRVNCISPFALATPLARSYVRFDDDEQLEIAISGCANLKGVYLRADDIANAALYLVSDESRYVSGHNLIVDGGFTIVNPSLGKLKQNP